VLLLLFWLLVLVYLLVEWLQVFWVVLVVRLVCRRLLFPLWVLLLFGLRVHQHFWFLQPFWNPQRLRYLFSVVLWLQMVGQVVFFLLLLFNGWFFCYGLFLFFLFVFFKFLFLFLRYFRFAFFFRIGGWYGIHFGFVSYFEWLFFFFFVIHCWFRLLLCDYFFSGLQVIWVFLSGLQEKVWQGI